jgi:hypothetical protein
MQQSLKKLINHLVSQDSSVRIATRSILKTGPSAQTFDKLTLESFQAFRPFRHSLPVQPH